MNVQELHQLFYNQIKGQNRLHSKQMYLKCVVYNNAYPTFNFELEISDWCVHL